MSEDVPMMSGTEMAELRERLGMTRVQFGNAIGYGGEYNTVNITIKRYESGERMIPQWIAATARALDADFIADFIRTYTGPTQIEAFSKQLSRAIVRGRRHP